MAKWTAPKDVQNGRHFLEKQCDVCTRKELPMRNKIPLDVPYSPDADGQMPSLLHWVSSSLMVLSREQIPIL